MKMIKLIVKTIMTMLVIMMILIMMIIWRTIITIIVIFTIETIIFISITRIKFNCTHRESFQEYFYSLVSLFLILFSSFSFLSFHLFLSRTYGTGGT
jgi:hypothetical protein